MLKKEDDHYFKLSTLLYGCINAMIAIDLSFADNEEEAKYIEQIMNDFYDDKNDYDEESYEMDSLEDVLYTFLYLNMQWLKMIDSTGNSAKFVDDTLKALKDANIETYGEAFTYYTFNTAVTINKITQILHYGLDEQ